MQVRYDTKQLLLALSLGLVCCESPRTTESSPNSRVATSARQQLGEAIFSDSRLSNPEGVACSSCHVPGQSFTGNNGSRIAAVAAGSLPGRFGMRNSPSAMYASFSPSFEIVPDDQPGTYVVQGGQFWDGRASTLAEQAKGPFLNPKEMNNSSKAEVIAKIASGPYASLFRDVFGPASLDDTEKAFDLVAEAIADFEKGPALNPFRSKFDSYLRGEATLTAVEAKGFELFKSAEKGNCIACHAGNIESKDPRDWLFTDFTYDNLGVPRNEAIPTNQDPNFYDLGLCQQNQLPRMAPADFDLNSVCGAFKVPTLRNIALTSPYMHNGIFTDLRDVVRFYVTRETDPDLWYPRDARGQVQKYNDLPAKYHANVNRDEVPYDRKEGETPRLNDEEIDAVVAFLRTLTDRFFN
jgi:cytochrome c peroxidase